MILAFRFYCFQFEGIEVPDPDRTFSGELQLEVGGRTVELIEVGPAHSAGDTVVYLPDASTVFCGDILFVDETPVIWEGSIENWISACDRILGLGCEIIVPGHGPVTDEIGVLMVRDYLVFVESEARKSFEVGQTVEEAIDGIDLGPYKEWREWERIVPNVFAVYRELAKEACGEIPRHPHNVFPAMAELKYGT